METPRGLERRVERLEQYVPADGCQAGGAAAGDRVIFLGGDTPPRWAENERCRDCGRLVRRYVGVDLALV